VILLPIGHQDSSVRRPPWVTYALIALCVVALLATHFGVQAAAQRALAAQERLAVALEAWAERPYLRIDAHVFEQLEDDERAAYEELYTSGALPPDEHSSLDVAAEQAALDAELGPALAELEAARREHPYFAHGLVAGDVSAWGLFAHMFMHAGWGHLLGNLFLLFLAAPALEDRWGRALFAAFYLASGLAAALFFLATGATPGVPLVGASGAISAVLGAFLVRFWSTQIRFWYFTIFMLRIYQGTFEVAAWVTLPLWFANQLLQAWLASRFGIDGGVAYGAHIGGFLFGAAAALAIEHSGLDAKLDAELDEAVTVRGNSAVAEALALREQGDLPGAIAKLAPQVKQSPRDADAVDAYWDACVARGCPGDAAHAVLALAQRELAAGDGMRAAQRFVEVRAALPDYGFDVAFVARLVPHLREMERGIAVDALRWLAAPERGALAPTLAQRAVDQARELDPLVAKQLARRLAQTELPDAMRERFRALAQALEAEAPDPAPRESAGPERHAPALANDPPDWDHTAQPLAGAEETPSLAPEPTDPEPELAPAPRAEAQLEIASPDEDWDALKLLDEDPAPEPGPRFASLKLSEATPVAMGDSSLTLALENGRRVQLPYAKLDAIALAAVRGLAAKPVLVIDLLAGWRSLEGGELRCVRLRSDRFDPRKLASAPDPLSALRAFVAQLVERSGAAPLGAADPARASALNPYADVATYQRELLEVAS
jgi:membrane associated rhomboid family serine protease